MGKNINELLQEGMYIEAIEACTAQINSGVAYSETYIVVAKCLLHSADYISDNAKELYMSTVSRACNCILSENITTPEEVLERIYCLKNELQHEYAPCRAAYLSAKLAQLAAAPSSEGWKAYNNVRHKSFSYANGGAMIIDTYLLSNEELLKAANLTQEEAFAKYNLCSEETRTEVTAAEHEIVCAEWDCARTIYQSTRKFLEERNQGSRDALTSLISIVLDRFTTSFIFYEGIESSNIWGDDIEKLLNEFESEEAYAILLEHAEVLTYMMEAIVFPSGKAFSILTGDRSFYLNKLRKVYGFIAQIDPSFEIPELPNQYGIEPQESAASGGGCYVATAVYGSYDCPQVWTLRRFRDNTLAKKWYGRAFIRCYYAISPTIIKWFGKTEWFQNLWKPILDQMVEKLNENGVEDTPYNDREW